MSYTPAPTKPCRYCGDPVAHDYDPEMGDEYFPLDGGDGTAAHWPCVWEDASGEWVVRTTQNAVSPAHVHERRYGSQKRAREEAAHVRHWNRREWTCGAKLDIVVVRQPVGR